MKRKTMILIISSLSTAGLLGMGAGVVTNTILSSHANNRSVGAGVQLSTVITVTNLGSVY
jgi:hypothetical protein